MKRPISEGWATTRNAMANRAFTRLSLRVAWLQERQRWPCSSSWRRLRSCNWGLSWSSTSCFTFGRGSRNRSGRIGGAPGRRAMACLSEASSGATRMSSKSSLNSFTTAWLRCFCWYCRLIPTAICRGMSITNPRAAQRARPRIRPTRRASRHDPGSSSSAITIRPAPTRGKLAPPRRLPLTFSIHCGCSSSTGTATAVTVTAYTMIRARPMP